MSGRIRVAIAGIGNCASSLVQGVEYYRRADPADDVPGLMHVVLGGYHVGDVDFVAAFDVDAAKVGLDLGKAIWAGQNNTIKFANVGDLGVEVQRGPTFDGLGTYYRDVVEESPAEPVDVARVLRETRAQVLVSYLPVGSELAQRHYAQACLDAGVAFVNAIPVFIASDPEWAQRFTDAGIPIVGDDIKSQVGATITHRVLARLMASEPDELYALATLPNLHCKVTSHVLEAADEAGRVVDVVGRLVAEFGAARLVWGSDFPQTHDRPYRELVALARRACAELSEADREQLLGGTALALWPELA